MNNIIATIEKITKGTKSSSKAREIVSEFFKKNTFETNWNFIFAYREKMHSSRIGRRAKKKISEIDAEILNYICRGDEDTKTNEYEKDKINIYDDILREEIKEKLEEGKEIPLIFIPFFLDHQEILIAFYELEIETLDQFISCEQSTILELFKYDHNTLSDLVVFLRSVGIELKVAHA